MISPEHQIECTIFSEQNVQVDTDKFNYPIEPIYDIILPLRILSFKSPKTQNFEKWKPFWKLMSHFENLKKKKDWIEQQKYIVDYIMNTLKLPNVTEDQILTILAIDHINGHTGI